MVYDKPSLTNSAHRLDKVTVLAESLSTSDHLGTLFFTALDVTHDSVALNLRDLRTLVRLGVKGVSDLQLLGLGLESSDKLVVNTLLDEDSGSGTASLTVVEADLSGISIGILVLTRYPGRRT